MASKSPALAVVSEQAHTDTMAGHVDDLRASYRRGATRSLAWRQRQLDGFTHFIKDNEAEILEALAKDLGKPALEAFVSEVHFLLTELKLLQKNLRGWMKPTPVKTPMSGQPGKSMIHHDPLGVVLIISPWNYPIQLALMPLFGAVAAGNCAIVKPSEVAPHCSKLMADLLPRYVDPDCIRVIEGGVDETTALLEERFDHICYTGNGHVGRIVMSAAAKHLTPVTLELGGQNPCIVDRSANLKVTANRILWGKFFNAGQTCIAPNHLFVHKDVSDALLGYLREGLRSFYGLDPKCSPDFGRIINERHFDRLAVLMDEGETVIGGMRDRGARYIAPTVITGITLESPIMHDEIFGPILPVMTFETIDEVIETINDAPKPLALFVFAEDEAVTQQVLDETSSGGVTVNHTWMHPLVPTLPFGGVGESGMGAYHGKFSFDTFTHQRAVHVKPTRMDPPMLYPPYTETTMKVMRFLS